MKNPKAIATEVNQQNYANREKQNQQTEIGTWNYAKSGSSIMGVSLWVSERKKGEIKRSRKDSVKQKIMSFFNFQYCFFFHSLKQSFSKLCSAENSEIFVVKT